MKKEEIKNIFRVGAIDPISISKSIANHQSKTTIGAHSIFLGQVRADAIDGNEVTAIEYTAQSEMANKICHEIKEAAFAQYKLSCMHIYHSLGIVKKGELCFFVFVSGPHRKSVFKALPQIVDEIKYKLPIFGKEIFKDASHQWKINQ